MAKPLTTTQKLVALLGLFAIVVLIAGFFWGAYAIIDFFASLVTDSGIEGDFALHHGLIGLVVFVAGLYGMWLYRNDNNRTKFTVAGVFALLGFILMLNDVGDFWLWFQFRHA